MTVELHLASVWEALADALGDDTALIHGMRSRSWSEATIVTGGAQQEFSDAERVGCVRERLAGYKAPR